MKKVLTYGTFDTLHFGHIRLFERARALGDYLVVGLSTDEFNLGKGKKALHTYQERRQHLLACRYVDEVIPEETWEQKVHDIREHGISIFTMGDDWVGKFDELKQYCEVAYLTRTPSISSTVIRNSVAGNFAESTPMFVPMNALQKKRARVLVFPCGSESGLEAHASLRYEKDVELFGASSVDDHGRFVYKNYQGGLPFIKEPKFIEALNKIIIEQKIDFVLAAYDDVLLHLSENRDQLSATLLTSPRDVVAIARSKSQTYAHLQDFDFVPTVFSSPDSVTEFPVFVKPDIGQGSQGVFFAKDKTSLENHLKSHEGMLICEYLPGEEFTVDCFTDRHGNLIFSGARKRARVKSGISVSTYPVDIDAEIAPICHAIMERLSFRGAWFFQVKRNRHGALRLLEVAPRIAGSMGGYRNWGVNFAALMVHDFLDRDVEVLRNPHSFVLDRALVSRYRLSCEYERVYIDLDETITLVDGRPNPLVMLFLYQCRGFSKSIVLVTRHSGDVHSTLNRLGISPNLFEHIVHLRANEPKSSVITKGESAVFVDDSFKERADVLNKCCIPVFSVDAVESLIDWRA